MDDGDKASNSGKSFWLIAYKADKELTKSCFKMGMNPKTKVCDLVEVHECYSWPSGGDLSMALLHVKPQKRASQIKKILQERCSVALRSLFIESKRGAVNVSFGDCPVKLPPKANVKSPVLMEYILKENDEVDSEDGADGSFAQVILFIVLR